jgi:GR25 family glycosyltransferase involved in LPS biosynthesis
MEINKDKDNYDKTICLNMIVKNESHIIVDTLKNLCSYINFSYWVISDTGSTDNTKELITDFFKEKRIPGKIVEHEWVDFAYNRTKALESAFNTTDFIFIFDADDSIVDDFKLPEVYDCDKYLLKFGKDFVYVRPLLFTNRKRWRFKGVLHEYLENIDPVVGSRNIEGNYHVISGRSGNRSKNPNKYIDDANILKAAHFKEAANDYGLSCRYAFYCAQSYKDSGDKYVDDAIEWYKKCLDFNMWNQEKFHSCFSIGEMYIRKKDYANALKYWYKSIEYDSERVEGIVNAVSYLRNDGQHLLVNALYNKFKNYKKVLENKLFLFQSMYNDQLEYENTISAYYVNDKESGYECCKRILLNNILDYNLIKSTMANFKFYIHLLKTDTNENALKIFNAVDNLLCNICLKNDTIDDNMRELWNTLFERVRPMLIDSSGIAQFKQIQIKKNNSNNKITNNNNKVTIMITFTTCKRFDLFKQTINSILNNWTDISKIDYWFCVDDNSSASDRKDMSKMYPWIKYYMKPIEEKGHLKSMNIIWDKLNELKPTYWIHMEDDFLFHHKTNYIEQSMAALNSNSSDNIKQILFNVNYGETIDNYNARGHINLKSTNNIALHDYKKGDFNYPNCHYWPHYSFRPSLIETKVILELGNFDSVNKFFEMDYALKWTNAGYKSAFFNRITCRHIGRLTSDKNTKNVKNAYELNNESQFFENENQNKNDKKIKIINLERRKDRKEATIKILSDAQIDPSIYEFVNAVDGKSLEPTPFLKDLFKGNDFGSRKGVIGCALSHYNLWKQLVDDKTNDYYVIMEDDFTICPNFKEKLESLIKTDEFVKQDVIFLGYHMFEKERQENLNTYNIFNDEPDKIVPLNKHLYIGGTFMYSINKNGAKQMLDYIKTNNIKHGIDYVMKINNILQCFECQPQLVFSEWNENSKQIDSDIQNIYDCLDFTKVLDNAELLSQFTFIPNVDIIGHDIYFSNKSLEEQLLIAYDDNSCIGFNTLGFFKNKIDTLKPSQYFKKGDGIYIKKELYDDYLNKTSDKTSDKTNDKTDETIKIKMLCDWASSEQLCKEFSNMCEKGFKWKNYELVWTDINEDIDYYVIINYPHKDAHFDPKRTIVFQMEPWIYDLNKPWGVKTWSIWSEPNPTHFLAVRGRKTECHNNPFWQMELTLNDLQNSELFEKNKGSIVSSIMSSKYCDEGHIARIDFLKFLEAKGDILLDIYGEDNKRSFTNYKGQMPMKNKSNGYKSYKYYFMMENNFEKNYITEKLWEPILCETLVFYYGCPNVSDYIDPRAFVQLDIDDFEKSYQLIKQAISEDWWSQRIDIIRQEKRKILNELAFFPTIDKIIKKV